jgi:hypothetical protein
MKGQVFLVTSRMMSCMDLYCARFEKWTEK